jgi:hypothetical protein
MIGCVFIDKGRLLGDSGKRSNLGQGGEAGRVTTINFLPDFSASN